MLHSLRQQTLGTANRGFTLIELMATLAVIALLAAMGAPVLRNSIDQSRINTQARQLLSSFNYARAQAISIRQFVTIASNNGAGDWTGGWQIYASPTANAAFDANTDTLLRVVDANNALISMNSNDANIQFLSFASSGRLIAAANVDIAVCLNDGDRRLDGRTVQVNTVGRASINVVDFDTLDANCNNVVEEVNP
jgi:type IV fimbrial biogenesis protein FimT